MIDSPPITGGVFFMPKINEVTSFLDKVFFQINSANINLNSWEIDHVCYRTSSLENYENSKAYFSTLGELLIEGDVNGRPIATYKLHEPIRYKNYIIPLIEVPSPKKGKDTQEGFEHIEIVIDISFDEILNRYPKCHFEKKGLSKELNPELEIEFSDCAIKFHHQSLEEVIKIEKIESKNS